MANYCSNITLQEAGRLLAGAKRVAVTTHAKPDGDAVGCVVALVAGLRSYGKLATGYFMPPIPQNLLTLRGIEFTRRYDPAVGLGDVDLIIVADTGAWSQLSPMKAELEQRLSQTLIIDHHTTGDVPAQAQYIDISGASCCEVVADVLDQVAALTPGGPTDPAPLQAMNDALFIGVVSDTGWFHYSNTKPKTHRLAARLLEQGVDHAGLFEQLEQGDRPEKLALMSRALQSLQLLAGGQVALMVLRAADFNATGARPEETEGFINLPQALTTVRVVVLLTEAIPEAGKPGDAVAAPGAGAAAGLTRVSFRSKPGLGAVDVAELAQQFGGGGHVRAAGAKVQAPVDQVVERVSAAVIAALTPPAAK